VIPDSPPADLLDLYAAHLEEWERRFTSALEAAGFDSVIVYAGEEQIVFRDDATYPFVAEPYFRAWAPLTQHPGSAVRFEPGRRPRLVFYQDTGFWHEPPAPPEGEWLGHFELHCVGSPAERAAALGPIDSRVASIGPPESSTRTGANDPRLLAHLDYTRARKTDYEVACIERANEMAALGHAAAQRAFADGGSEFAIDQAYCRAVGQRPTELPYTSIVALDRHAAVLHYQKLRHDRSGPESSFLLDAGASFRGYAADITRTIVRGANEMQSLIAAVDAMQLEITRDAGQGIDFVALNDRTHERVANLLHEQGLLRVSAEQAYESGLTRSFLPHGLGHLLGLQVHDAGGRLAGPDGSVRRPPPEHPMLRLTRVLEPGFVVTIEPGIYFIPSLLEELRSGPHRNAIDWPAVERLVPFGGVRIEDDVLVTTTGVRNLSRPALDRVGAW